MNITSLKCITIILSDYTDQPVAELESLLTELYDYELIEEYVSDNYTGNVVEVFKAIALYEYEQRFNV